MEKKVNLRKRRIFSESFKKERVKEYESGKLTVLEISRLYGIAFQTIYNWIYKYSGYNKKGLKIVEHKDSYTKRVKELQGRIKELERIIGQKQINIDYLEKMIEFAKKELGIDIKKNFGSAQSNGSESTNA
ncbi:MAG: transposase [Bacteroidota bacterium]